MFSAFRRDRQAPSLSRPLSKYRCACRPGRGVDCVALADQYQSIADTIVQLFRVDASGVIMGKNQSRLKKAVVDVDGF
jgi:hypothetical protein